MFFYKESNLIRLIDVQPFLVKSLKLNPSPRQPPPHTHTPSSPPKKVCLEILRLDAVRLPAWFSRFKTNPLMGSVVQAWISRFVAAEFVLH